MFNIGKKNNIEEGQEYKLIDAKKILQGLGGKDNIKSMANCITRLRLVVRDVNLINIALLKGETGASNVVIEDNNVQVVYGLKIEIIRKAIDEEIKNS